MSFKSDIDIDFGSKEKILEIIPHIPAAMRKVHPIRKHATGIHVTDIPYDAVHNMANIDYTEAEDRGYLKIDLLNVHVYTQVKDENHLIDLMKEPKWGKLADKSFVEKLVHLNGQYYNLVKMPEPIDSIDKLAMFLAIIRPGKKHLIGYPWDIVSQTVWDKGTGGYTFKKSHSISYSYLVVVHMNLLCEQEHKGV